MTITTGIVLVGDFILGIGVGTLYSRVRRNLSEIRKGLLRVQNLNSLEQTFVTINRAREQYEQLGLKNHLTVVNVAQFALLWNMDLSALLNALDDTEPGWQRQLHARVLALTIYECAEDFPALLGKDFRRAVESLAGPAEVAKINPLSKEAAQLWEKHNRALKEIRTNTIGHRDHNAKRQIDTLTKLSADQISRDGVEMMDWTNKLYGVLSGVLTAATARNSS